MMTGNKNSSLSDRGARKRLKQKALERWENEGGKIEELPKTQKKLTTERPTKEKRATPPGGTRPVRTKKPAR